MWNGMKGWYVMDPAYKRLEQLVGPEEAKGRYRDFNFATAAHSPSAPVETELNRGTHALMAKNRGQIDDWLRHGGMAEDVRRRDFPEWLRDAEGHPYHTTAHASGMRSLLERGDLSGMKNPKVPAYAHASGVPETGFQTEFPVADAHFTRGIGLSDVRTRADFATSAKMPEAASLYPWWRDKVAKQVGLESVPAQAISWGMYGPATGVATRVGAPKLEILADRIYQTAMRHNLDPGAVRDDVLLGRRGLYSDTGGKPGAGAFVAAADRAEHPGIDVWHGSPHDFDQFDLSKIGTGEGAQAYGHGIYMAESPEVAKMYRDQLSGRKSGVLVDDNPVSTGDSIGNATPEQKAAIFARQALDEGLSLSSKARNIRMRARQAEVDPASITEFQRSGGWHDHESLNKAASILEDWSNKNVRPDPGYLYQARIRANPEHFLDWDKPLSEQPEHIQGALGDMVNTGRSVPFQMHPDYKTGDVLSYMREPQTASAKLREAGIPGIKYLDQGSRTAGDGSRNYVVFDPSLIDTVHKWRGDQQLYSDVKPGAFGTIQDDKKDKK
jgi:hypothetical protein